MSRDWRMVVSMAAASSVRTPPAHATFDAAKYVRKRWSPSSIARSASSSDNAAVASERSRLGCLDPHAPMASRSLATDRDFIALSTAAKARHRSKMDSASVTASSSCHGHALVRALATAFSSRGTSPCSRDPGARSRPRRDGSSASASAARAPSISCSAVARLKHLETSVLSFAAPSCVKGGLRSATLAARSMSASSFGTAATSKEPWSWMVTRRSSSSSTASSAASAPVTAARNAARPLAAVPLSPDVFAPNLSMSSMVPRRLPAAAAGVASDSPSVSAPSPVTDSISITSSGSIRSGSSSSMEYPASRDAATPSVYTMLISAPPGGF